MNCTESIQPFRIFLLMYLSQGVLPKFAFLRSVIPSTVHISLCHFWFFFPKVKSLMKLIFQKMDEIKNVTGQLIAIPQNIALQAVLKSGMNVKCHHRMYIK